MKRKHLLLGSTLLLASINALAAETPAKQPAPAPAAPPAPTAAALPFGTNPQAKEDNQVDIAPISAELSGNQTKQDFTITNSGSKVIIVYAKATLQKNPLDPETSEKTTEVKVVPSIDTLKPGEKQVFRAFINQPSSQQKIYRIFFTQVLPKPKVDPSTEDKTHINSNVTLGLRFGVPIYYNYTASQVEEIQAKREKIEAAKNANASVKKT